MDRIEPRHVRAAAPAKFLPPDPRHIVAREPLFQCLDGVSKGGLAWLIGPAGSGKSSSLAGWLASRRRASLWLRLDESDTDPGSFFATLSLALARSSRRARLSAPLPSFSPEHLAAPGLFARRFGRALFERLPRRSVLVFDNLHDACADPLFVLILECLLDERPPGVTVAITSREMPPAPLTARLSRADNVVIGWPALRLTEAEAGSLGQAIVGRPPDAQELRLADGWAAGLVLLMRLREDQLRVAGDLDALAAETFAALARPVFDGLPEPSRHLLLACSCCPIFDDRLAQRLADDPQAGERLLELWRTHLFIERTGASPEGPAVFRIHPLFRAFLEREADCSVPSTLRSQRFEIAARWLQRERADPDAAQALLARAELWEAAAGLLQQTAPVAIAGGRLASLMQRIAAVPSPVRERYPMLDYWRGVASMHVDPRGARALLERAYRALSGATDHEHAALAAAAIVETAMFEWQWAHVPGWLAELDRTRQDRRVFTSTEVEVQVLACAATAMFPAPTHPWVIHARQRARELLRVIDDPRARLSLMRFLIGFGWWRGEARAVRHLVREAVPLAGQASVSPGSAVGLLIWCAIATTADGETELATQYLDQAEAIGVEAGIEFLSFHVELQRLTNAVVRRDADDARAILTRLEKNAHLWPPGGRQLFELALPGYLMLAGEPDRAFDLALAALDTTEDVTWVFGRTSRRLICGQIALSGGRVDEAIPLLSQALEEARAIRSELLIIVAQVMLALADPSGSGGVPALARLEEAFASARRNGFRHLHPYWIPELFAPAFALALDAGIETRWIGAMIRRDRLPAPPWAGPGWPRPIRLSVTGRFTLECDGRSVRADNKASHRLQGLLALVALEAGDAVPLEKIIDALWPDADGDNARRSFDVCLHRARRLLGVPQALVLAEGRLRFDPSLVWIDLDELARSQPRESAAVPPQALARRWLQYWQGPLLDGEPTTPWLLAARRRWDARLSRSARALAQACREAGDAEVAAALEQRALDCGAPD